MYIYIWLHVYIIWLHVRIYRAAVVNRVKLNQFWDCVLRNDLPTTTNSYQNGFCHARRTAEGPSSYTSDWILNQAHLSDPKSLIHATTCAVQTVYDIYQHQWICLWKDLISSAAWKLVSYSLGSQIVPCITLL